MIRYRCFRLNQTHQFRNCVLTESAAFVVSRGKFTSPHMQKTRIYTFTFLRGELINSAADESVVQPQSNNGTHDRNQQSTERKANRTERQRPRSE